MFDPFRQDTISQQSQVFTQILPGNKIAADVIHVRRPLVQNLVNRLGRITRQLIVKHRMGMGILEGIGIPSRR